MIAPNLLIIGDIFPFERSHDAMLYSTSICISDDVVKFPKVGN